MPVTTAVWVLQQEYEFAKKHFSWGKGPPTIEKDPWWIFGGIAAAGGQSAIISMMPYAGLIRAHGFVDQYVWLRTAPQHALRGFRAGPGVPKGLHPFGWSVSKKAAFRLGAAKVAARFIPYVGWGLLAYDLYTVGKWAKGHLKAGAFRVPD